MYDLVVVKRDVHLPSFFAFVAIMVIAVLFDTGFGWFKFDADWLLYPFAVGVFFLLPNPTVYALITTLVAFPIYALFRMLDIDLSTDGPMSGYVSIFQKLEPTFLLQDVIQIHLATLLTLFFAIVLIRQARKTLKEKSTDETKETIIEKWYSRGYYYAMCLAFGCVFIAKTNSRDMKKFLSTYASNIELALRDLLAPFLIWTIGILIFLVLYKALKYRITAYSVGLLVTFTCVGIIAGTYNYILYTIFF